mmetsp:Transcript_15556/g.15118  ORF Transcript_15556/g.15118 Transcript_15556/m.15118 type:complete len:130 (+) Transcript_15556:7-396(+)
MDITSENFLEKLPLVQKAIEEAEFIAFDAEFSGLNTGQLDSQHDYDSVEDRYRKLKHTIEKMFAFQWGICTFHWHNNKYICRPFNFYVFPMSKLFPSTVLQFQASSVRFLMENHFDFNKLFASGIVRMA